MSLRLLVCVCLVGLLGVSCGGADPATGADDEPNSESDESDQVTSTAATDGQSQDDGDSTGEANSGPETLTRPSPGGGEAEAPVVGSTRVTIGEYTYEFWLLDCSISEDALMGLGYTATGIDPMEETSLQFEIGSESSLSASNFMLIADGERELDWNAGSLISFIGPITEEHSQIVEYNIDGMTASGSARFVEENAANSQDEDANFPDPEFTEGTFEFHCDE